MELPKKSALKDCLSDYSWVVEMNPQTLSPSKRDTSLPKDQEDQSYRVSHFGSKPITYNWGHFYRKKEITCLKEFAVTNQARHNGAMWKSLIQVVRPSAIKFLHTHFSLQKKFGKLKTWKSKLPTEPMLLSNDTIPSGSLLNLVPV